MSALSAEAGFFRALALPRSARARWLARTGAGHPTLVAEVRALLRAHDHAGDFLAAPAPGAPAAPGPGARLGPFRLRRRIGAGGCGLVFAARAPAPGARLVALKLITPGCDSPEAVARFDTECRAVARLRHPGIPRFVAAGRDRDGTAYLAMELIRGRSLTAHCDRHRLTVRARLGLFAQCCDVLDYVHDHGIRHGDFKPANLLIRLCADGRARPVLIDFGLASLPAEAGSAVHATAGTVPYLSPEQVGCPPAAVDHRSDLYAAGVVLCQLLTGCVPFTGRRLDELRPWLATKAVPRPSRVFAALGPGKQRQVARRRRTSPAGLTRSLGGAIDALVQRALAREPAGRFQSAAEFAAAVRQLLTPAPHPRPASAERGSAKPPDARAEAPLAFPASGGSPLQAPPAAA